MYPNRPPLFMLTDLKIRATKPQSKNYKIYDQYGLFLLVTPTNCRYWRLRYQLDQKRHEISLGSYPEVNLLKARKGALEAREKIKSGIDPLSERIEHKRVREDTFAKAAGSFVDARQAEWSETHKRDVQRIFQKELLPSLGRMEMAAISKRDLKVVIDTIIARKALTFVRDVLAYYGIVVRHYNSYSDVPVFDHSVSLRAYLPTLPRAKHHAALPENRIGEFLENLKYSESAAQTRIGLELLLLTMVRTTELRGATWAEFDFPRAVWVIPAERMKNRLEHRVPLSSRVLVLLAELQRLNGSVGFLLHNERNRQKMISENTFLYAMYKIGYRGVATPHGFRSLASTVLNEKGFHQDAVERQLAHAEGNKVRAAYNRGDYWEERVRMVQWWSDYISEKSRSFKGAGPHDLADSTKSRTDSCHS
jgi:integrase